MSRFGKYSIAFRLALSRAFVYRFNILIGGANVVIWFGGLILLYKAAGGAIGGYSSSQIVTYILCSSVLAYVLFTQTADRIADEIVEGDIVNYLLRPINYFLYWAARSFAVRLSMAVVALAAALVLSCAFPGEVILQTDPLALFQTAVMVASSFTLMLLFEFFAGMFSFWTGRAFGARWMFLIFARFLSGAALPLDLMPPIMQTLFSFTPFPSLIYAPVKAYLGQMSPELFWQTVVVELAWIGLFSVLVAVCWHKAIKSYEAYGS